MDNPTAFLKKKEGFLGQRMIVLPPDILRQIVKNDLIKDFYLTAIGYYPHAKFHDRKRNSGSSEYILLYCLEGVGEVAIKNSEFEIHPNQFIIIPPNVSHHYRSSLKNPWSIYWVHYKGYRALSLFNKYCEDLKNVKSIPYNEILIKNFLDIIQILDYSFEARSLEIANLKLMYFLASLIYQEEISPSRGKKNTVTESIDFMKKNIHRNIKIKKLASDQNLSVSRYSEIFREKTGYSPIHYFIKLKIQKSCQFLYFTDLSIKEICAEVGFTDPYYFSRIFKKIIGVPPSKYKENYKK